jgi:hypothetical protein
MLRAYLQARTHALRWSEERIRFKNDEIVKTPIIIADLPNFSLNVDDAAHAALDTMKCLHRTQM